MTALPPRYEPVRRLGQGGGGEVWAVRDRVSQRVLALKVIAVGAGDDEVRALVREAVSLSALEGLGVPRVLAFGSLADGRRYMVRELVEGQSLEDLLDDESGPDWIEPLARAAEQLTVLHRAGLLHGDIKPANVIAGEGGAGTLVDLGLAAPWKEGGTLAQGLTPKFAAPELLVGEPLTVRAEVYALGATLAEGMARRGSSLDFETRIALTKIAARATELSPSARYPSVDELASALRHATGLRATPFRDEAAWPVLGLDASSQKLASDVAALGEGEALAIQGPNGSGRTTLLHRLAWTLGAEGRAVVAVVAAEAGAGGQSAREAIEAELAARGGKAAGVVLVVDDLDTLDEAAKLVVSRAAHGGARLVAVGPRDHVLALAKGRTRVFDVPALDARSADELVKRAVPSLPDALRPHLLERLSGRPGKLRAFVRKARGRAIVSAEDIDAVFASSSASAPPSSMNRSDAMASLDVALERGRFDEVTKIIEGMGPPRDAEERVRIACARARIALARSETRLAADVLDAVATDARGNLARAWKAGRARTHLRAGEYARALELVAEVVAGGEDVLTSDALSVGGLALAFTSEDKAARETLERAVSVARTIGDKRAEGVALGSLAIVHQRAGRAAEAKVAYEGALATVELARDAWNYAATRLNLASLAQSEGDFAGALAHLEAAVDMGRRLGGGVAIQQALLNLANLDLYLGRFARASASIESLASDRAQLGPTARAQLLGLEGELAMRNGDLTRGARAYEQCAAAWEAQGRPMDAAEARLEAILGRTRDSRADLSQLARELEQVRAMAGAEGFREHEALAQIARGTIALLAGDETSARAALDEALVHATRSAQREWSWRALDARARLSAQQGSIAIARRDTEQALAMLEETASKLPRDLREVFWDDPRRRALRQAHTATIPIQSVPGASSGMYAPPTPRTRTGGLSRTHASPSGTTTMGAPLPTDDRLALIFEITRDLASEHDMDRLLARVTDHAIALLGAEHGFVVLANDRGELEARAARSRQGDDTHAQFSRSVAETVVRTGEPVIAERAKDDARLAKAVSVHALSIQSIACVPIRGAPPAGRTIGALYIETRLRPGSRFEAELPTLAAFADQAAIAIENARLLEENRARAEELAATNVELEAARDKLAQLLDRKTEQLETVRRDLKQVRAQLRSHFGYGGLVGTSAPMRRLYALLERLKDTDVPVLITGESGTGKEVVAKAVHAQSPRARRPFLGVNCGAIPANLLESELFGHVKGAFTGADRDKKGLFREAEGGTLLLDEIGEMPLKMQTSLLRTLQESTVRPLGAAKEEKVDVRVVAATNRDLAAMVAAGEFREDLYYRLHVIELKIPPLRERSDDIPALIDHFLTIFAARHRRERKAVGREALRRLVAHDWPGNVRQLEHVLLNSWLMSDESEIAESDLSIPDARVPPRAPPAGVSETVARSRSSHARPKTKTEFKTSERDRILSALTSCNWNRVQAAKMIGVPRRTFYRRLKEFGILDE